MVLPLYATIERLDKSYLEASLDLGASQFTTFLKVTIPLTMPGIITGVILVFIPCLGSFLTPDLLGGANAIMIGNVIERQFKAANDWPFGAALSFMLMYATFAALMLRASAASAFAWAQLQHTDLGGVSADQHHAQAHAFDSADHTGTLAWAKLNKTGSSLADLATRAHSDLTGLTTGNPHTQYALVIRQIIAGAGFAVSVVGAALFSSFFLQPVAERVRARARAVPTVMSFFMRATLRRRDRARQQYLVISTS